MAHARTSTGIFPPANPQLITGALDSDSSKEIMKLLVKMNKKRGVTSVFVSHDIHIASYGRRTIALKDGEIVGDTKGNQNDFKKMLKTFCKTLGGRGGGS